ncbi:DUF1285 domain-containing protein [Methylopila sp. Yamaguchi]|uniref:DUF1285 domain-containing protein n=1 Tax=Methylopila sp. Yamaguchi TaxID=1437817 RepID=UPI000CABB3B2|nr:DUF1285 domain-containing protein [Methylopila sp. Yamaguchi]GBD49506.1 hypothetical protein METY_2719 [Methylopila sp. Yamaguchi]
MQERQLNVMADQTPSAAPWEPAPDRMTALAEAAREACARGVAPVHKWHPERCGRLNLVIRADGSWIYEGSAIRRPALVKLFSTVLRRDPDGYVLVTPAEKLDITVEDAPFLAVELASDGEGPQRRIRFRTNVDEVVDVGPEHALRFEEAADGGFKPYVHVRSDLWALVARSAVYDLVDLADERDGRLGVWSGGVFFPMAEASA